jgi:hypothetical protein
MTVSLVEIFAAARAHAAPLAAESAGYLLLAVADHVVAAPRAVAPEAVELSSDGAVRLRPHRGPSQEGGAEAAVRGLLARALEVAGSTGPALRRAADRREETGLTALVRELEVALIPVNRAAAKRALSRLHRETERARDAGKLDALLRAEEERADLVPSLAAVVASPPAAAEHSPAPPPPEHVPSPPRVEPTAQQPAPAPPPAVELTLTPEPLRVAGDLALTKPEPVVLRARERGTSTPQLGTVVTAQTLPDEEADRTERAPEASALELDTTDEGTGGLGVDVDVDVDVDEDVDEDELTPALPNKLHVAAETPSTEPEPSLLPDVVTAMVELHTGLDSDEAPTRLREAVTELKSEAPTPLDVLSELPPHEVLELEGVQETAEPEPTALPLPPVVLAPRSSRITPEPEQVQDEWLTASSLVGVISAPTLFVSERVAPELHEASTWDPGPVVCTLSSPVPPALLIAEPPLEPSPYAPAALVTSVRDVSELVESFHVSGAAEEQELRSALKEMAGLELTPMPHPLVGER